MTIDITRNTNCLGFPICQLRHTGGVKQHTTSNARHNVNKTSSTICQQYQWWIRNVLTILSLDFENDFVIVHFASMVSLN